MSYCGLFHLKEVIDAPPYDGHHIAFTLSICLSVNCQKNQTMQDMPTISCRTLKKHSTFRTKHSVQTIHRSLQIFHHCLQIAHLSMQTVHLSCKNNFIIFHASGVVVGFGVCIWFRGQDLNSYRYKTVKK